MRNKASPNKLHFNCLICLEEFRPVDLQSFHEKHRLHSVCKDCLDTFLNSFVNTNVVKCPLCRIPVDKILYI